MRVIRKPLLFLVIFTLCWLFIRFIQIQNSIESYPGFRVQINEESEIHSRQLLDLNDFYFLLKASCNLEGRKPLLGVILIHSYVGNDHVRAAHRQAATNKELETYGFKRVFLLAGIPKAEKYITQDAIRNEAIRFHDIVQGNFIEAYRNLTYKHIMGLRWARQECYGAQFIIKADDDIVFDPFRIQEMLKNTDVEQHERHLKGYVLSGKKPIREKHNKWYVTEEEYPESTYPSYLSGWFYITNPKTAQDLVVAAENNDFFWIDDIFITGILADQLKIPLEAMNEIISENAEFIDCCIRDVTTKRVLCDYLVGPNGGDDKMILNFIRASRICFIGGCRAREEEELVKRTCVAEVKDLILQRGQPIIQSIRLG